ncbi:MAG: hypothetical protein IPQ08_03795 [Chitinophagaceae bacterium]|nr:hypothetical protein [Chitinophagaceae bacterium]
MKRSLLCLLPIFFLGWSYPYSKHIGILPFQPADSTIIEHNLDGLPTEWPAERFTKDEEDGLQYAFDNDASYLYVIISVKDIPEQMKMMRMSMKMYIDLKGKKKENMGVEFPVKKDPTQQSFSGGDRNSGDRTENPTGERRGFDIEAMRQRMALNLISMKIFGFEGMDEPKEIGLSMFNTANLFYNWDSTNTFHIEYSIPLSMIAEPKTLDNKSITIGWKVLGMEIPSGAGAGGGFSGGGRGGGGAGGRPGAGSRTPPAGGGGQDRQASFEKMREEQNIWGKYTFHLPASTRGF